MEKVNALCNKLIGDEQYQHQLADNIKHGLCELKLQNVNVLVLGKTIGAIKLLNKRNHNNLLSAWVVK